jgi:hypothetical protein
VPTGCGAVAIATLQESQDLLCVRFVRVGGDTLPKSGPDWPTMPDRERLTA